MNLTASEMLSHNALSKKLKSWGSKRRELDESWPGRMRSSRLSRKWLEKLFPGLKELCRSTREVRARSVAQGTDELVVRAEKP